MANAVLFDQLDRQFCDQLKKVERGIEGPFAYDPTQEHSDADVDTFLDQFLEYCAIRLIRDEVQYLAHKWAKGHNTPVAEISTHCDAREMLRAAFSRTEEHLAAHHTGYHYYQQLLVYTRDAMVHCIQYYATKFEIKFPKASTPERALTALLEDGDDAAMISREVIEKLLEVDRSTYKLIAAVLEETTLENTIGRARQILKNMFPEMEWDKVLTAECLALYNTE